MARLRLQGEHGCLGSGVVAGGYLLATSPVIPFLLSYLDDGGSFGSPSSSSLLSSRLVLPLPSALVGSSASDSSTRYTLVLNKDPSQGGLHWLLPFVRSCGGVDWVLSVLYIVPIVAIFNYISYSSEKSARERFVLRERLLEERIQLALEPTDEVRRQCTVRLVCFNCTAIVSASSPLPPSLVPSSLSRQHSSNVTKLFCSRHTHTHTHTHRS